MTTNTPLVAANFGEARPSRARRPLRARPRVRRGRLSACGTAGRTTPSSATASAASGATARKLHAPLPPELYDGRPAPSSSAERLYAAARAQPGLPLRELGLHQTTGASLIGFVGTPEQLADHIVTWQDAGAVDGFTIMGSTLPYELARFVDHVVPILQARGRFRTDIPATRCARTSASSGRRGRPRPRAPASDPMTRAYGHAL